MILKKEIEKIKKEIIFKFKKVKNYHELLVVKNFFIGKNSSLSKIFSKLTLEEKKQNSYFFNETKIWVKEKFDEYTKKLNFLDDSKIQKIKTFQKIKKTKDDLFIGISQEKPELDFKYGTPHPINLIINKIYLFFEKFNGIFCESPDIENVKYNFDLLNISKDHPSRNMSDTFYIDSDLIMRTHTTNFTARILNSFDVFDKPIFYYSIGNVYRNDEDDLTHLHQFTQLDTCLIGNNFSLANLKWILKELTNFIFGKDKKVKFRTNTFPFTTPSMEIDVECSLCKNEENCSICKNTGWIEIIGGGIIAPEVLEYCSVDPKLTVLAFGVGIERLAMLKFGISDIRNLYKNNFKKK